MRRKGGIGQLFKGVIIGIVLLLAIIGTTSILDKGKNKNTDALQTAEESTIQAPSINIVSENQNSEEQVTPEVPPPRRS